MSVTPYLPDRLAEPIIAVVDAYCARHGVAGSTFGLRAVAEATFVERLREGRVTLKIAQKAIDYIRASELAQVAEAAE
jgi:hypothetical protein